MEESLTVPSGLSRSGWDPWRSSSLGAVRGERPLLPVGDVFVGREGRRHTGWLTSSEFTRSEAQESRRKLRLRAGHFNVVLLVRHTGIAEGQISFYALSP